MDPLAPGPAVHYYMIRGGSEKRNITIWESGTVGGEYIKTYGHYHIDALPETYWILAGEGIVLLQKLIVEGGAPQPDRVEEFKAIKVSAEGGSAFGGKAVNTVYIPPGYGHLAVNTGATWLVTADDSPIAIGDSSSMPAHANYEMVKKMHGFAYYVVEKNGASMLVPNPLYKEVRHNDTGGLSVLS